MKILSISYSDSKGGAAKSAQRIHLELLNTANESTLLVRNKFTNSPCVQVTNNKRFSFFTKGLSVLERVLLRKVLKSRVPFSLSWFGSFSARKINKMKPDIVHLHWVNNALLSIRAISKIKAPIVWTFHDAWAMTGGCHITYECEGFTKNCNNCPLLKGKAQVAKRTFKIKKSWEKKQITVVTPSSWLASNVQKSTLFKKAPIFIIPNPIDTQVYNVQDKKMAKKYFGLDPSKKIILFGSIASLNDPNKGSDLLIEILENIDNRGYEIAIFGNTEESNILNNLGYKIHYFGNITDEIKLSKIYSAADVFIVTSRSENLPYTIIESMSCGTPCVAFNVGGISDIINHQINGYLVKPYEVEDFIKGIEWITAKNPEEVLGVSMMARTKIETKFDSKVIVNQYINVYENVIESQRVL